MFDGGSSHILKDCTLENSVIGTQVVAFGNIFDIEIWAEIEQDKKILRWH